ncbi:protein farnesyltransferase/geranylgeranyltransferase type-1 subunit alpha [Agrilus planipennis]|uniref:Protein farnesyltransferase/geranylgeranyltransferase type-1 subunit alpha n=1 Tax=Agrilus planipennis TaxID=224129 RepID=A0A1W4XB18_AGRPL|nr:protein farnesyltransferase/geranylgeranyltransferase type-1 subunit alpha [Agrilus planipennis]XP_018329614.1 protein farnesyltransferase/geranylgeranyltransferase type-1 subunit alpha [Agrilus planipennis]XP_018329615.1 protein farnesyltransferase/geranylgeranyltransferase type-1 subunit alpha [Agrilus planipennis]
MSDSSSEENEDTTWVFYRDRPEWKDIEPLSQDDGVDVPVVEIAYSEKFKDVYDYFRAVVQQNEQSERALQLTEDAVKLNAANYTVWQYRRNILKSLNKDLWEEMKFAEKMINQNPKNYQVWHHRKVLVEELNDASKELYLTEIMLAQDAKNYHAWQHRQWAIKTYKLFDDELNYVDELLIQDIRNNSAWNQRYFVINNTTGFTKEVIEKETDYTLKKIEIAKENESAWNYLRGILLHDERGLSKNTEVSKFCENLYTSGCHSPFLIAMIVDMCDENVSKKHNDPNFSLERALNLCDDLATKYDIIRKKYWEYFANVLKEKAEGKVSP